MPAFSTGLGKALLAELEAIGEDALERHLPDVLTPLTPQTIVDRDTLRRELAQVRAQGYALDRGENVPGIVCFAFALDFGNQPTDAISCSVPVERMGEGRDDEILEALRRTKLSIERMAPVGASSPDHWA